MQLLEKWPGVREVLETPSQHDDVSRAASIMRSVSSGRPLADTVAEAVAAAAAVGGAGPGAPGSETTGGPGAVLQQQQQLALDVLLKVHWCIGQYDLIVSLCVALQYSSWQAHDAVQCRTCSSYTLIDQNMDCVVTGIGCSSCIVTCCPRC